MMIFGTKSRKELLEAGEFNCPQCQAPSDYEKKRSQSWFYIYIVPLIPLKKFSPYVECRQCRSTYIERVLDDKPGADISPEFEQAAGLIMAKMILADGEINEDEIEMRRDVYERILGTAVEPEAIEQIVDIANSHPDTAEAIAKDFSSRLNLEGQELVMKAILLIAMADGDFAGSERQLAERIGRALGMSPAHMKGLVMTVTNPE